MNKHFSNEKIAEMLKSMSEDETRELIASLNAYRSNISKNKNEESKNRLCDMMKTTYKKHCMLTYVNSNGEKGKITLDGADFPYYIRLDNPEAKIKAVPQYWWLRQGVRAYEDKIIYTETDKSDAPRIAHIRPTLVFDIEDESGLKKGDIFTINDCKYQMISDNVALKSDCLSGSCTFDKNIIKYILKGWLDEVVEKNKNETV